MNSAIILSFFLCVSGNILGHGLCSNVGPKVTATKGAVWPKPQEQNVSETFFVFQPSTFEFVLARGSSDCSLLQNALNRYWKICQENYVSVERELKYCGNKEVKKPWLSDKKYLGYLDELTVNLTGSCNDKAYPSLDMNEKYKLWVTETRLELQAQSIWGILRGLETFSQLIYVSEDGPSLRINATVIKDFPRYKHRGLLIDTARHYIPLDKIYKLIDALSYNKMNVLHWHIVDDQSFPYVSIAFPELSALGAYNRHTKVYLPEDIENIIEYARLRGIRVIPEFDTPGHTASWGVSHPEILTSCEEYDTEGPMDPSKNGTFIFLNDLLTEVKALFKDHFIHLGGDEVEFTCWQANENVTNFMKGKNFTSYKELEGYYVQKVVNLANDLKFRAIVWEEVFVNGVQLPNDTIVHVWKTGWRRTLREVTEAGKYGLLSACWYLSDVSSGGDWSKFYYCDPAFFNGSPAQQEMVLGGEACMWSEYVNEYNIISRVWPRASAVAEKLWSPYRFIIDLTEPSTRLEEHTCRMNRRGIDAQPPNGPGYCD